MNDEMALLFRALGLMFPLKACGAFVEYGDLVCGEYAIGPITAAYSLRPSMYVFLGITKLPHVAVLS